MRKGGEDGGSRLMRTDGRGGREGERRKGKGEGRGGGGRERGRPHNSLSISVNHHLPSVSSVGTYFITAS